MRNVGLKEAQARIKIARRNISNLRYAVDRQKDKTVVENEMVGWHQFNGHELG